MGCVPAPGLSAVSRSGMRPAERALRSGLREAAAARAAAANASPRGPRSAEEPPLLALLLALLALLGPPVGALPRACPAACICAADVLSCSRRGLLAVPPALPPGAATLDLSHNGLGGLPDGWLAGLPNLEALLLGHNRLRELSPRAFRNASRLRHLDLSSNRLRAVEAHYFEGLASLEELLLYDNRIERVADAAFSRLSGLREVYLGWNDLTAFPFRWLRGAGGRGLRTLDLSSNSLSGVPVEELAALPESVRNGLYLHNNPVRCSCRLYGLLRRWERRGFSSVRDFFEEHTCRVSDEAPRSLVKFLKHGDMFENCSAGSEEAPPAPLAVLAGEPLLLGCNASLPPAASSYMWISPHHEPIRPPGNGNRSVRLHPNGSLSIAAAEPWHSGVYVALATSGPHSSSRLCEVNVTVRYPKPDGEAFSTGLTTLLGCIVSLLLVLLYLYLTPCRRLSRCKKPAAPSPPRERSARSSILSTTPPATDAPNRKGGANKHVVFLEPVGDAHDGKIRPALAEDFPEVKHPKVLQLKSDSESISSVFSDTPIVS